MFPVRIQMLCKHYWGKQRAIYCLCMRHINDNCLCFIEDSIPHVLFSVKYPVTIRKYKLLPDSIIVKTGNCCDKEYGIKTHIINQ